MGNLKYISTEELQEELERRKEMIEEVPIALEFNPENPDDIERFRRLKETCQSQINGMVENARNSDIEHYIYESAMEFIFGKNIFDWINEYDR